MDLGSLLVEFILTGIGRPLEIENRSTERIGAGKLSDFVALDKGPRDVDPGKIKTSA